MALNYDSAVGQTCACGEGVIEVQCEDCAEYEASCHRCWASQHTRYTWWHWALIWECEGYFRRYDFSRVVEGACIQLGHNSNTCPNPSESVRMIHVHCNGVHGSTFRFCQCNEKPLPEDLIYLERVAYRRNTQLIQARLFPATVKRAETVFSYSLMKTFQLLHLEGKLSLFDFIKGIRRYTDNSFINDVSVSSGFALLITLVLNLRLGPFKTVSSLSTCMDTDESEGSPGAASWDRPSTQAPSTRESHCVLSCMPRA